MKFLKLVLVVLFITSCVSLNATSKRQLHEPEEIKSPRAPAPDFYVKHDCWKSPFNPHEVLQYWVKLGSRQLKPNAAIAVVGNPKINWREISGNKSLNVPIPPGEIASLVVFVFAKTQSGTVELMSYGYYDDLGVQRVFVLNAKAKCYEKHLAVKQQNSCLNN